MIGVMWEFGADLVEFFRLRFDPFRDTIDILLVTAGLLGGALSIRRITSVDPIIALGQEQ